MLLTKKKHKENLSFKTYLEQNLKKNSQSQLYGKHL